MKIPTIWLWLCVLVVLAQGAHAQEKATANTLKLGTASPAPATIKDMAWLTGYWRGEGLGGHCEEMWGSPIDDRMYGTFTLRRNNELAFSEHLVIVEEAGSLIMKVKHFTADFHGWETKEDYVSFPLVKIEENAAYFSGLTLRRGKDDSLKIYLVLSQNGVRSEEVFDFKPVEL